MVYASKSSAAEGFTEKGYSKSNSEADGIRHERKKEISSMLTGKTKRYSGVMNVIIERLFPFQQTPVIYRHF